MFQTIIVYGIPVLAFTMLGLGIAGLLKAQRGLRNGPRR